MWSEPKGLQSAQQETMVYPVKRLFLVKGKKRCPGPSLLLQVD